MRGLIFMGMLAAGLLGLSSAGQAQAPVATYTLPLNVIAECNITSLSSASNFAAAAPAGCGGVPAGARFVQVQPQTQGVNFTLDGSTTPTSSVGFQIGAGVITSIYLTNLSNIQFIQAAASATLHVAFSK